MKAKDIQKAGVPAGPLLKLALSLVGPAAKAGLKKKQITDIGIAGRQVFGNSFA